MRYLEGLEDRSTYSHDGNLPTPRTSIAQHAEKKHGTDGAGTADAGAGSGAGFGGGGGRGVANAPSHPGVADGHQEGDSTRHTRFRVDRMDPEAYVCMVPLLDG